MSKKKKRVGTDDPAKEFKTLLDTVAKFPRPKVDYGTLSQSDFLNLYFYHRLMEIQASYMILLRATIRLSDVEHVQAASSFQELVDWSRNVTPEILYRAYCFYPHWELVGLLADLKMEEVFINLAMEKRLEGKKLTCEFIRLDVGEDRTSSIQQLLKVNKIISYRPWQNEDTDIRQSAWERAVELWTEAGKKYDQDILPLPAFPAAELLFPIERQFWEGPITRAWEIGRKITLDNFVPKFEGEKETIPQRVREHLRNDWEKIARRESIFEYHVDEIRSEVHPKSEEKVNSSPDVSARMFAVLKEAQKHKRWGPKAIMAFKYYLKGKTEKEAAELAGITDKTFRNYIVYFQKIFASKK